MTLGNQNIRKPEKRGFKKNERAYDRKSWLRYLSGVRAKRLWLLRYKSGGFCVRRKRKGLSSASNWTPLKQ